jgi:hypothetical protein
MSLNGEVNQESFSILGLFSEKDNKIAELEKKLRKVRDFCHGANIFQVYLITNIIY